MKSILLIGALFTSGGAVAAQNEVVEEKITENIHRIREMFEHKQGYDIESIKENGYPYPSAERLAELTEEQAFAITSFIDQVNADYDFSTMTDEEIEEVLLVIKEELAALHEELGLDCFYGHPGERGLENAKRAQQRKGHGYGPSNRQDFSEEDQDSPSEDNIDEEDGSTV
jgi:biotin operon repressor